jgi:hypothetical protein
MAVELTLVVDPDGEATTKSSRFDDYVHRGPFLAHMELVCYLCVVAIVEAEPGQLAAAEQALSGGDATQGADSEQASRHGRKANLLLPFDREHPHYGTKLQRLRSKYLLPICRPPRVKESDPASILAFEEYILTLCSPFAAPTYQAADSSMKELLLRCSASPHAWESRKFGFVQAMAIRLMHATGVSSTGIVSGYVRSCANRLSDQKGNIAEELDVEEAVVDGVLGALVDDESYLGAANDYEQIQRDSMDALKDRLERLFPWMDRDAETPLAVQRVGPRNGLVDPAKDAAASYRRARARMLAEEQAMMAVTGVDVEDAGDDLNGFVPKNPAVSGVNEEASPLDIPPMPRNVQLMDPQQVLLYRTARAMIVGDTRFPFQTVFVQGGPGTGKTFSLRDIPARYIAQSLRRVCKWIRYRQ